jgi:hypothetical protein
MLGHLPLVIVVGLLILFSPTLWVAAQAFLRALSGLLSKRRAGRDPIALADQEGETKT